MPVTPVSSAARAGGCLANTPSIAHIYFTNNGTLRMTTKQYDCLDRRFGRRLGRDWSNVAI